MTTMYELLGIETPLAAAPMAGGVSTVKLAQAVSVGGGFPFLAGGYKTSEAMADEVAALTSLTENFGVNLFVPNARSPLKAESFARYRNSLLDDASALGVSLPDTMTNTDDAWSAKVSALVERPVRIVSLTFGLPPREDLGRLHKAGIRVLATVTSVEEARAADDAGVDGLVVQGSAAGGHSAVFDQSAPPRRTHLHEIVARIGVVTRLPMMAAGGIMSQHDAREAVRAGAGAVAIGTALLLSDEAGTSHTHRSALLDPKYDQTVLTRAFTGRLARALPNDFVRRNDHSAPIGYPAIHHLTKSLRSAAAAAGDAERLHLWAGTGYRQARQGSASRIVEDILSGL